MDGINMTWSFTLVSGALKNVGDFLIVKKATEAVERFLQPDSYITLKRTEDFGPHIDKINETNAIIICGGPGYKKWFYPAVYPFLKYLAKIRIPIIPFALGWSGLPRYLPDRFVFAQESKSVIHHIHKRTPYSSVRDEITREILIRHGVQNVINTGCPTLFDIDKMRGNASFRIPAEITSFGVSMAQNPALHTQNVNLLKQLKGCFPKARRVAFFHRGVGADEYTTPQEGRQLQLLAKRVSALDYEIVDLAYDAGRLSIYNEMDFHVGYRVHAHAYCISQRIPSFLLWEDGRGQGMSSNLGLPGVPAFKTRLIDHPPWPSRIQRYVMKGVSKIAPLNEQPINHHAVKEVLKLINDETDNGFLMFSAVPQRLKELYSNLQFFFIHIKEFLIESE